MTRKLLKFSTVYQSLAVGMDELTAGPTLFESMAQKLAQHASEISGLGLSISQQEALIRSAFMGTPNPSSVGQHVPQPGDQEGVTHFTAPICDTFVELFHLKDRSQWLRRQTILIVLQQVLGGTIER